ncbi:amidase [Natronosalvus halobius]|uniref:amidase n=1 Tax=Natronosalvus halobius TaxID=2953746 RepID=UPI00209CFFE4|nr:amidase family protein [Natronosalvus halobius]
MGERENAVRKAASDFGIALDEDAIGAYADEITKTCEQLETLDPSTPDGDLATDVHEGDDEYNAFRYRCSLKGDSGQLTGLKVAVKDNIAVAGVPMTCGSTAVEFTPEYSATVARRLVDHGADVVGTTNMDEFAYFTTGETCAYGPVENPVVEGSVPGGSSAGSAAAVAADLVDVALGSDTAGSIRIPASFCGVVGFKPTHRAVPCFGFADLSPSLDHIGPLAKTVETAALTLETIGGPSAEDPGTLGVEPATGLTDQVGEGIEGLHVGVVTEMMDNATEGVVEQVRGGIETIEDAGATVEDVSIPEIGNAPLASMGIIGPEFAKLLRTNGQVYSTSTGYSEPWRTSVATMTGSGGYGEIVRNQLLIGDCVDAITEGSVYVAAQNFRQALTASIDDLFEGVDALITPTTPIPAPEFDEVFDLESFRP